MKLITIPREALPTKRDMARMVTSGVIREPIKAGMRKKVLERAKNTCQWRKCNVNNNSIKLDIHHKNMKSDDNRLSNFMALCPNHHRELHKLYKLKYKKGLLGERIGGRVVRVKQKPKQKQKRKPTSTKKRIRRYGDFDVIPR